MTTSSLDKFLSRYDWFDHPDGPKFVETHRNEFRTSGHWLFIPGAFSSFHKVTNNEEIWAIHIGKLLVHIIDQNGVLTTKQLGFDLDSGEFPLITVPAGHWQAAEIPDNVQFAFGTNICSPPFSFDAFTIAERSRLLQLFPKYSEIISRLTR